MLLACPHCGHTLSDHSRHRFIRPFPVTCPQCTTTFLVIWKIRLTGPEPTIICSWCAGTQVDGDRCSYCGRPFYGYSPVSIERTETPSGSPTATPSSAPEPAGQRPPTPHRSGRMSLSFRVAAACAVIVVVLAVAVRAAHERRGAKRHYLADYVLALYGIKSGVDRCSATCDEIVANWHKNDEAGSAAPPTVPAEERENMAVVKSEVDRVMGKLEHPPEQYRELAVRLHAMYDTFADIDARANSPSGSPTDFEKRVQADRDAFAGEIASLRSSMPPPLEAEIKRDTAKYRLAFIE